MHTPPTMAQSPHTSHDRIYVLPLLTILTNKVNAHPGGACLLFRLCLPCWPSLPTRQGRVCLAGTNRTCAWAWVSPHGCRSLSCRTIAHVPGNLRAAARKG